jgi:hypothetical protein
VHDARDHPPVIHPSRATPTTGQMRLDRFAEFEADREESVLWMTLSDLGWSPREINEIIQAYAANPNMTVRTAHGLATSFA